MVDPEYLRRRYASLSDEALLTIDRSELVEMAQTIFDLEVSRRQLVPPQDSRPSQPDPIDEEGDLAKPPSTVKCAPEKNPTGWTMPLK